MDCVEYYQPGLGNEVLTGGEGRYAQMAARRVFVSMIMITATVVFVVKRQGPVVVMVVGRAVPGIEAGGSCSMVVMVRKEQ